MNVQLLTFGSERNGTREGHIRQSLPPENKITKDGEFQNKTAMPDIRGNVPTEFTLFDRTTRVEAISGQTFEFREYLQVFQRSVTHNICHPMEKCVLTLKT